MKISNAQSRRLSFVAPAAYTLGGMQVWLSDLARSLQARGGWIIDVALTSGTHHDHNAYQQVYPHLPVTPLFNPTGSSEGRRRVICNYLLRQKPDLLVGVNIYDTYPAVRRARAQGFKGKVAFSLHAIDSDLLADIAAQGDLLDAVITTNHLSCELARRAGMENDRVLYAPYGVHLSNFPASLPSPPPLRIAWVGRIEQPQKRVHDLPQIFSHLSEDGISFQATIAGDGPEAGTLKRVLDPWIRSGAVVMAGTLSSAQLASHVYATHHALLITSSWETGPIVAWEAMAAGLAVVSSAYVGSGLEKALVDGHTAQLFPVGDVAAAALALARLQDAALRERLCQEGRNLVEQRYTEQASSNAWIEAFEKVLSLPDRPLPAPEPPLEPAGRLERLIGIGPAESLRKRLSVRFQHSSPGGEWPHTAHGGTDEEALLRLAGELDHHA